MQTSATRRLADVLLDGKLEEFVVSRRTAGKSWRRIALDLRDEIDVEVTDETLRSWFPEGSVVAGRGP